MKNSGISSATRTHSPPYDAPPRSSFALTGKSAAVDPRCDAVRADLADIRLADRVFAPHYAAAVIRTVIAPVDLRQQPDPASAVLAQLLAGETFEVLEFTAGTAWGCSPAHHLVGYVDTSALNWPAA